MVLVLLAASLAGCVSGEPPVLEVTVSETDTAVVETYQNGMLVERAGATVFLDFSGSTSAVTYTLCAGASEGGLSRVLRLGTSAQAGVCSRPCGWGRD